MISVCVLICGEYAAAVSRDNESRCLYCYYNYCTNVSVTNVLIEIQNAAG